MLLSCVGRFIADSNTDYYQKFSEISYHIIIKTVPTEFIMSGYFKKETSSTRLMSMTFIRLISFICMTYILILS